jgi:hypothetical protein
LTARWNEARTTILVDQGNGVTLCLTGGPEFEALRETALDYEAPADPGPDMPSLRAVARIQIVAMIEARQLQITGPVPSYERDSWGTKADRARAWLADTGQPVPAIIAGEAALNGQTALQVATRIKAKADAWEPIIAAHTALRQNAEAAIDAATTPAGITAAIDTLRAALTQPE